MMEWNDLNLILGIGRAGTLAGAARLLNMNHSTVFRRLNNIEKRLGVRLFDRFPSGYVLTEAGEAAMRRAEIVEDEMHQLSRELAGKDMRLQGPIRLTAPEAVSQRILGPHLAKFCELHPDIQIDLVAQNSVLQLSRREADLALRVTSQPPDTAIGRRICDFQFTLYAAHTYLKKNKKRIEAGDYDWVQTYEARDWFTQALWKKFGRPNANIVFISNSIIAALNVAREGLGVAPLPCFLADPEKKLQRLILPPAEMKMELWLLTHPDLRHTTRVKALMNYLYNELTAQADLFNGRGAVQQ